MQAIVRDRYGAPEVLRLAEIAKPVVTDDSVIVRVRAAAVNAYDWHMLRGHPYIVRTEIGLRRPKVAGMGVDLAGTVEAVGRNVTEFRVGDDVYGECGGAFAEFVDARVTGLALKPTNPTFEEAAAVPMAGFTALQALRDKGGLAAGQRVLVNGAAGGVGTFAVQLAKAFGAEVTGVCGPAHVDMVRSIGADEVVDYSKEDFTRVPHRFDLVLDIAGTRHLPAYRRILRADGTLVVVGGRGGRWIGPLVGPVTAVIVSRFASQRFLPFLARRSKEDLQALRALIDAGKIRPVIDRSYSLADTAEAIAYVEGGHAGGKVVIAIP